jgi:hypothetical protein
MKENKIYGTCKLCGYHRELRKSHIISNFVVERSIRESITGKLRMTEKPNLALEDGYKEYLLCGECEHKFNVGGEIFFSRNIDARYAVGELKPFTVSEPILYYAASTIWRQLVTNNPQGLHPADVSHLDEMEILLRNYLLGLSPFPYMPFLRWHMLIPDLIQEKYAPERINQFLRCTIGPVDGFIGSICYRSVIGAGILITTISSLDDTALPVWDIGTEMCLGSVIYPGKFTKDRLFHQVIIDGYLKIPPVSPKQHDIIGKRLRKAGADKIFASPDYWTRQVDESNQQLQKL